MSGIIMTPKESRFCGIKLRSLCLIIGYLHLLSSTVDLFCHMLTLAIVTNGFQCDVNYESLKSISLPWLEPILLMINLGTHGFYPYPRVFHNQYHIYVEQMSVTNEPKCYPGMLHVYLVDVLNLLINLIWLRIVVTYVGAVHKRNPDPMRMFFSLSVVKLVMQAMYLGYYPFLNAFSAKTVWFLKLTDILIALFCLVIVHMYTKTLRLEKAAEKIIAKPPSYVECLISGPVHPPKYESKDDVSIVHEEKKPAENIEKP